ncbi:rRNA maturation RNase YbeY [Legionella jordanis]|uniref:Endoribonuclease YbeY n=1 Tax=Legionella jordanis TaxID=456 RepID=A0A0W0VAC7_9GAMM|nr:rRNA maturation RNase YbeY [Legionella jordanis]KTD17089.1 metal dependent hydrolase [Legionella jordanis]RMX03222.1 rRNA maturation RNase YbeY [Legionella jordanis]RMX18200.1 rRNA maturation RNase YbeY [Legionella jordanis]VEH12714.1 metal-dependent hydrolase [Legionella jordanis]HAT8713137.1 rRNA maturation RNase YbeY [Legionella jordanis]
MSYHIDLQLACNESLPVEETFIIDWARLALADHISSAELTLRFVDQGEIQELNRIYRKQDKPTNVLAFPATIPDNIDLDYPLLGDIIICPAVLLAESTELDKPLQAHWAHIVIHGVLHLLGYDHIIDSEAEIMQGLEISLLAKLGFANPYETEDNHLE